MVVIFKELKELRQDLKLQQIENGKKQEQIRELIKENRELKEQIKELTNKIEILESVKKRGRKKDD